MVNTGRLLKSQNLCNKGAFIEIRVINFKVGNDSLHLDLKTTSKLFYRPSL